MGIAGVGFVRMISTAVTATQVIMVVDTTAPSITVAHPSVTLECASGLDTSSANLAVGGATVTDACHTASSSLVSTTDATTATCGNTRVITRTLYVHRL